MQGLKGAIIDLISKPSLNLITAIGEVIDRGGAILRGHRSKQAAAQHAN
jgi:hypothetical protein